MKSLFTLHGILYFLFILSFIMPVQIMAADEEAGNDAMYFELSPPFVVNLKEVGKRIHFLQARIQVLVHGKENIDHIRTHNAPVRDALIILLSAQSRKDINTSQKKKALQKKAFEGVKNMLNEETGEDVIKGLYFTNFVVQ